MKNFWDGVLQTLAEDLSSDDFNAWILPLQIQTDIEDSVVLKVANKYLKDHIDKNFKDNINAAIDKQNNDKLTGYVIKTHQNTLTFSQKSAKAKNSFNDNLNDLYTFQSFVEGKSNQLGLAASQQVAISPGKDYNPLYIYGATGLGKTHLMHSIGHEIKKSGGKRILYIRSELFVRDMINSLQQHTINKFKDFYQSLDVLLMDDIQFLAGKDRSQEEFFHSLNYLLEGKSQVVVTCDRYPKEIDQLEDRLKSRFGSGLTVALEPPDFETRVGILKTKSKLSGFNLDEDAAYFIAKLIKSNVRELEGALNNVYALSRLTNSPININLAKKALRDLISVQNRVISLDNIQHVVAKYFNITINDLISKSRSRSIVRPRQIAMSLTKELTNKSLPEIGNGFGGRDHTTVIHACKKVSELRNIDTKVSEDYRNLHRLLSA